MLHPCSATTLAGVARHDDRKNWQARLTPEATDALDAMLQRRRITYTAFVEGLARHLAEEGDDWVPQEVFERARYLDSERYSRRWRGDNS